MNSKKRKLVARKNWINRYEADNENSLKDKSQQPVRLAKQKITEEIEKLILSIRDKYSFGPQSISTHLLRNHQIQLSAPTIWRVLKRYFVKPLKRHSKLQNFKRYTRPIPGDGDQSRFQLNYAGLRAVFHTH